MEKSQVEEKTFALTADVSEAHRQIPIAPQDWHLLGCRFLRVCQHGGNFWRGFSFVLLVSDSSSTRTPQSVLRRKRRSHLVHGGG